MQIEWKDIYKTGNAQIDAQHVQWFSKANYFLEASDKESRSAAARKMYQYTRLHFQDEDRLMRSIDYPDAREHTRRHNDALVHMQLLLEQIAGDTLDMEKWRLFLADLFLNHIVGADLKLAAFITSQKRAAKRNSTGIDSQWGGAMPEGPLVRDSGTNTRSGPL
jgi:hemerythrin-like metal-binding protein